MYTVLLYVPDTSDALDILRKLDRASIIPKKYLSKVIATKWPDKVMRLEIFEDKKLLRKITDKGEILKTIFPPRPPPKIQAQPDERFGRIVADSEYEAMMTNILQSDDRDDRPQTNERLDKEKLEMEIKQKTQRLTQEYKKRPPPVPTPVPAEDNPQTYDTGAPDDYRAQNPAQAEEDLQDYYLKHVRNGGGID